MKKDKFEVGKWYCNENSIIKRLGRYSHISDLDNVVFSETYSLTSYDNRVNSGSNFALNKYHVESNYQPATPKQIEFMLGKVAESKGYVKGVEIKSLVTPYDVVKLFSSNTYYDSENDILWVSGCIVYEKGKWAELLPQEEPTPETPETLVLKGVKIERMLLPVTSDIGFTEMEPVDLHLTATHLQQLQAYFTK
jgi:hypothetical protein